MIPATPVSPKVTASLGGGGAGVAISTILVWLLTSNGVDVPEPVATAIGALITAGLASIAAYRKRDYLRDMGKIAEETAPRKD